MKRILWGLLILLTLIVSGCGAGGKVNGADTGGGGGTGGGPTGGTGSINYTIPNNQASGIGKFADIYIVFNQAMNTLTVTDASFSVTCGGTSKSPTVTYDGGNLAAKLSPDTSLLSTGWGENNTCTVTAQGSSLRTEAGNLLGTDYSFTFSTSAGSTVEKIELSASKLTLETKPNDKITFTVFALDPNNAAAANSLISIASTGGTLSASSVTTDAKGMGTFDLSIGNEKANRQISVTLTAGATVKSEAITISGTTLSLLPSKLVTTPGDLTPIELTATLRDAATQPITGATISFTSSHGNSFTASPGFVFTTGYTGVTDSGGQFKVKYNGSITGPDTVTATSSGATKDVSLTSNAVSQAFFGFVVPADPSIPVPVNTLQDLQVEWINSDGSKKANETLTFFTTKGFFGNQNTTMTTAVTDVNGLATLNDIYNTGATAGPATIAVYDSTATETATLILDVRATTPTSIDLQVVPGVIPVTTAAKTSTATLKATVRDANAQAVAGKVVGFSIFKGPGAGETINPATAITDSGGVATSTFTSGSMPSGQDGVEIRANIVGVPVPAKATMTIAQSAATLTIGTTNKINKIGSTGYSQEFTVLITDSSGAAVEGAQVSLSLVPIRFYTGPGSDTDPAIPTGVFLSEDANRNYILDSGEDCAQELDQNLLPTGRYWESGTSGNYSIIVDPVVRACTGNKRLDPGAVASIDPKVTTLANGMGIFKIYYPKNFGHWVDIEITASADVTGTNASAKVEAFLNVEQGDTPYLPSPFGLGEAP